MIASYYFWKWADNDLPGRPRDVQAALLRGEMPPALQPFDARTLLRKLESAAAHGRKRGEEWDWQIEPRATPQQARFVFVTCPILDFPDSRRHQMCKRFFALDLSGCEAESGALVDFFLPKLNCFASGQAPDEDVFDIGKADLPVLLRTLSATMPDAFAILTNRQNHFVQCCKTGHRYRVEWRENDSFSDWSQFDQWAAQYPEESEIPLQFVPEGCSDIRHHKGGSHVRETQADQEELLRYTDTLRIFETFVRGEPRPPHYRWVNINHILP